MKKNAFVTLLILTSCSLFEGPEGLKSLVDIADEPSGTNCNKGGLKITSGVDKNRNGLLDTDEVSTTKFLCSPENGISSIVISNIEAPGSNCPNGGVRIEVGKDLNSDGQLSQNEIEQTRFICNGLNGLGGSNGLSSLINSTPESPGANCTYGGVKLESGIDNNKNGQLDPSEILQFKYVCNGKDGIGEKEIRFKIGGFSLYSANPSIGGPFPRIFEFDIRNYPSIDSAVFVVFGTATYSSSGQPKTFNGTFQLVDDTNGNVIANSTIISDDIPTTIYKSSKNFINALPKQKINLRADIVSDATSNIIASDSYLILIRK